MEEKKHILIFGDYDVDGMSATSILYLYLKEKGVKVSYFLPNRYIDEYGLTKGALTKIKEEFNPDLIITVDCGITAVEEVEFAKNLGLDMIITDHHEVPKVTPNCLIINPKQEGQDYPFKELCGSGVSFKVVQALEGIESAKKYLDIAALATIADIVELKEENRIIVQLGLKQLQHTKREGLKMLFKELNLKEEDLNSIDIAFKVAPKINASGRMGKAEVGLKLLIEKDKRKLGLIVKELLELNTLRQDLCQTVYEDAINKLKGIDLTKQKTIVLKDKNWDAGLLGIVAARVSEEFYRPTILLSEVEGRLKGSARSIEGIDIHKAINCINVPLEAFGGHTMAAGLTVLKEHYEAFKQELEACVDKLFDNSYFIPRKEYDLDLKISDATLAFVKEMNLLAPFGHKNPLPIFNLAFKNAKITPMKNFKEHLTLTFHKLFGLIHFNGADNLVDYEYYKEKHALIELQLNSFRGKESVRAIIKTIQFSNLNTKEINCFIKANYLNQLTYKTTQKSINAATYKQEKLQDLIKQTMQKSTNGTLVVFSKIETYEQYKTMLNELNVSTHLFEVKEKIGLNSAVLGLNSFNNLNSFTNIIFADTLLNKGFLEKMQETTNATIYVSDINYQKSKFYFSLKRETFALYYNAFKVATRQRMNASNIYFYFNALKEINKHIQNFNYVQFFVCLKVFAELKIIEEVNLDNVYYLKLNKNVQSSLENSELYQALK